MTQEADAFRQRSAQAFLQARQVDPHYAPHADHVLERLEQLGEGGMGTVYRVKDHRLGREAALKLMREHVRDPIAVQRFLREARLTAQLDHPNIPPVYEFGTNVSGTHYMLMRVVEGKPLSHRIRELHSRGAPTVMRTGPVAELLEVLVRVGEAVAYAHSHDVVHRDLKPDNLIVGKFGEVMVMDWGLAFEATGGESQALVGAGALMVSQEEADEAGLTLAGTVLGTPGYMPPEQAGEGGAVDGRADVFALGAILVAVLTGRAPVEGTSAINKLFATMKGRIARPRDRNPHVPRDLNGIAERALAVDRDLRTPSPERFVAELKAFLAGQEVPGHRYGVAERVVRAARRRPTLMLGATLGTIVVALGGLAGMNSARAEAERAKAVAERERAGQAQLSLTREREANERTHKVEAAFRDLTTAEQLAARRGQDGEVRRLVDSALEQAPYQFVRWQGARLFKEAGLVEDARRVLSRSVEILEKEGKVPYEELLALHYLELESLDDPLALRSTYLERALKAALESGEENEFALYARARAMSEGSPGDASVMREAIGLLGAAIERRPGFRLALLARAHGQDLFGDHAAAVADYEQVCRVDPGNIPALYFMAVCQAEHSGDSKAAVETLTRAIESGREVAAVWYLRGTCRLDLEQFQGAVEDLSVSIELLPAAAQQNSYVNRGIAYSQLKKFKAAFEDLDLAVKMQPEDPIALANRGSCLFELKRFDEALRDLNAALSRASLPSAHYFRGRVRYDRGQYELAEADFSQIFAAEPRNYFASYWRARTRMERGDHAGAVRDWDRYLALIQSNSSSWNYRGSCHFKLGDYRRAVADHTKALELKEHSSYFTNRGHANRWLGKLDDATSDYENTFRLNPKSHAARRGLGRVYIMQSEFEKAVEQLDRAIGVKPDYAGAYGNRAEAKLGLGDRSGAEADCAKAFELDPALVFLYDVRARIKLAAKDLAGARKDWERYLELGPVEPGREARARAGLKKL